MKFEFGMEQETIEKMGSMNFESEIKIGKHY